MSRILKLLKQAKQLNNNAYQLSSNEAAVNVNGYHRTVDHGRERSHDPRWVFALVIGVFVIAIISVVVSVHSLNSNHTNQVTIAKLLEENKLNQSAILILKNELGTMKKFEGQRVNDLFEQVALLNNTVEDGMNELQEANIEQQLLKSIVADLKTTDKLILNKTITLNTAVNDMLQSNNEQGRKL